MTFDARVAGEHFAAILASNTEVDVGWGDFRIAVYHTRVPGGGARARVWGKTLDKWFKSKISIKPLSLYIYGHLDLVLDFVLKNNYRANDLNSPRF